ncbi:2Fe-2S iron-sulfur cluster-binding protein [Massilia putida]|uniref:2Fe-2S iron-sulfur cluster-binding protein n=1 Tax=Massilia putida TaxID=1141883 RepID=UPI000AFB6A18|nr:2Fe-2S iron-sulfur cluster-binding protein [Massilia putida]
MLTPDSIRNVTVDGVAVAVSAGSTMVAAIAASGSLCTRRSVTGQRRFAFCGIGQCQECRVTIDGAVHRLACRTLCRDGMTIVTGDES